ARSIPTIGRALRTAGVPVGHIGEELPLASRPAVRPLLALLRVATDPELLDSELAEMLLASSLGGADPMALRKLRRGLRRLETAAGGDRSSDELLVLALRGADVLAGLGEMEAAPVRRVIHLLTTTRETHEAGAGLEQVLGAACEESGLRRGWVRGGGGGSRAGVACGSACARRRSATARAGISSGSSRCSLPPPAMRTGCHVHPSTASSTTSIRSASPETASRPPPRRVTASPCSVRT